MTKHQSEPKTWSEKFEAVVWVCMRDQSRVELARDCNLGEIGIVALLSREQAEGNFPRTTFASFEEARMALVDKMATGRIRKDSAGDLIVEDVRREFPADEILDGLDDPFLFES
jgi:hypothetical protein